MANPRKFSEKIALHHQKQAEETAAFEAIMREVSGATRGAFQKHLHITQNLGAYRGGSLPNVNQMTSNSGILQTALQNLKDIEQGKAGHRDRSRPIIAQQRGGRGFPTRADCSPYGAAYLSPPPDTSWRRTNSDSALHTSTMGQQLEHILSSNTPPTHRRVLQVAEENSVQDSMKYWDPKKLGQVRPKSCEVPNINIYPSQEQESGIHIPISNHAGSLPDLSVLQFPSPLSTPLDDEEQNFTSPGSAGSNVNLSPSLISPTQASPPQQSVSARRNLQSSPSPLVLTNVNQMRLPLSPPVTCVDPNSGMSGVSGSTPVQTSSRVRHCMFPQVPQRQHPHGGGGGGGGGGQHQVAAARQQSPTHRHLKTYSPPPPSSLNPCIHHPHHHPGQMQQSSSSSSHQSHPHQSQSIHQHHITPQVHVTPPPCNESHAHQTKPSLTQYRNSESTCQSPTSPLSQTSYSPVQSPGLPPTSTSLEGGGGGGGTFSDAFYIQQNTNQIQHQLEQFTMLPDSQPSTLSSVNSNSLGNLSSYQISPQSFELTDEDFQRLAAATSGNQEFNVSSFYPSDLSSLCAQSQQQQLLNTISTQQSSPQHQTGHQNQLQQQQSSPNHLQQQQQQHHHQQQQQQSSQQQQQPQQQQQQLSPQTSNKIPHIIFTGADDFSRQDFAKELGNAITGFNDFESDFFPGEETWKMGLDPLDLDAVQMLTDPNLITDAATEDSFKLDRQ